MTKGDFDTVAKQLYWNYTSAWALSCKSAAYFQNTFSRSSHTEEFLEKGVLKICGKFTGEHPCRSAISIKLLCNFNEIAFRHGCSPVNLLHIFRKTFLKNTSGWLLLLFLRTLLGGYFWKKENVKGESNLRILECRKT